jgi:hypothetical protein
LTAEFRRLGIEINPNILEKEADEAFERFNAVMRTAKVEIFAPLVEILGNVAQRILDLKKAWAEGGIKGIFEDIIDAQRRAREEAETQIFPPPDWVKQWVQGQKAIPKLRPVLPTKKTESPALEDALEKDERHGRL